MPDQAGAAAPPGSDDPRWPALIKVIERTGANSWSVRFDEGDAADEPTVWSAIAMYPDGRWEVASARDPLMAALRLCDQLIDGGRCVRCGKPTMFLPDEGDQIEPLEHVLCVFRWMPGEAAFLRSCELAAR